ncbi:hypothetical protein D9757_012102 [Collybiopsis confluens]|uniref:SET domain-containing protein n=1 Tax=Collybiopsis confluens TaxID=2823264 RepID=A0A8H5D609_9AGAR|nr:hypothetical protein D9757_012102 [Collybiopsis confluens]
MKSAAASESGCWSDLELRERVKPEGGNGVRIAKSNLQAPRAAVMMRERESRQPAKKPKLNATTTKPPSGSDFGPSSSISIGRPKLPILPSQLKNPSDHPSAFIFRAVGSTSARTKISNGTSGSLSAPPSLKRVKRSREERKKGRSRSRSSSIDNGAAGKDMPRTAAPGSMATGKDKDAPIIIDSSDSDDGKAEVHPIAGKIPGAGPVRPQPTKKSSAAVPAQSAVVVLTDSDDEVPRAPSNPPISPARHTRSISISNSLAGDYESLRVDSDLRNSRLRTNTSLAPQSLAGTASSAVNSNEMRKYTTTKPAPPSISTPIISQSISSALKPRYNTSGASVRPKLSSKHPQSEAYPSASSSRPFKHPPPEVNPTASSSSSRVGNSSKVRHPSPMIISSDSDREQVSQHPSSPPSVSFVSVPVFQTKSSKSSTGTPTVPPATQKLPREKDATDESEKQWIQSFAHAIDASGEANAYLPASAPSHPKSKPISSRSSAVMKSDDNDGDASVREDTAWDIRFPQRRQYLNPSSSSSLHDNVIHAALFPLPGPRAHQELSQIQSSNNSSAQKDAPSRTKTTSTSPPFLSSASKPLKTSTGQRSMMPGQISGISSTLADDHGERDSSDSDSRVDQEAQGRDVNALFSLIDRMNPLTKHHDTINTGAVATDKTALERQVQEVHDPQSREQEEQSHLTQILELKGSLRAMKMGNLESPPPDLGQGADGGTLGHMPEEEEPASDGLPPLEYVDIDLDSLTGEVEAPVQGQAYTEADAVIKSAAEAEGDDAIVEQSLQDDNDNVDLATQLNNAYARQMDSAVVYESGAKSGFTSDSEVHVQNMLDTENELLSPLSSVPSSHSATLAERMIRIHTTDATLAGRSVRSRSPSSEDTSDVRLRRSSRARRPPQRSPSDTSSSAESFTLLGNYDTSASWNIDETPPRSTTPEDLPEGKLSSNFPSVSLGGLPVVTWVNRREWLRHQPPPHRYSKDLKHELHDYINSYHPEMRQYRQMTHIYEAMMFENTCEDEPYAPLIKVQNDVDDDESTPPWEFYYTNDMWLGEGVSPPSRVELVGCDCEGKCTKKTCKCWKRQEEHTQPYGIDGFMYDSNGLLKMPGHPVFECNSLCNCGEECRNRVVGEGRKCKVIIKKTKRKGWGVFACERIPKGAFIGIYSGELLGHEESEKRAVKYDEFGRTYLFDIDWWYMPNNQEPIPAHDKAQDTDLTPVKKMEGKEDQPNIRSTHIMQGMYVFFIFIFIFQDTKIVFASINGQFTRFLNHSCDPNAALTPVYIDVDDIERPLLTIFSRRDIQMHEEITFSYSGDIDDDEEEPQSQRTPKRGQKKTKRTNANHNSSDTEETRVHVQCQCGAANCRASNTGKLWRT